MKCLTLTILCLAVSGKALAQFHTISNSTPHYRVHSIEGAPTDLKVIEEPKTSTPSVADATDDVHESVSTKGETVGMEVDSMRKELIQRYLSVSFPLGHIHVTSPFGIRKHPIFRKKLKHDGIDLRAKYEEVYSVMDGEVTAVGSDKKSGIYVIVRYIGGYTCSYCHLSQPMVGKGDSVKAGEVIAISGNTGTSTGAHLHFGVRDSSGKCLDPMVMLEFIRKTREDVVRGLQNLNG